MICCILLITHLLADFTFQPAVLAEKKKESFLYLLLHSLIYLAAFTAACFLFIDRRYAWLTVLLISLLHFSIDWLRKVLESKFNGNAFVFAFFIGDQILHAAVLFTVCSILALNIHGNAFYESAASGNSFQNIVLCILLFAIILDPTAVFIKKLFQFLSGTPSCENKKENLRVGTIIGKLERIITAILVLCGQYGVIGLVLTAKSIARFKQLDDKAFAERYLVGTLASLAIALAASIFIKNYLCR